MPSFSDSIFLFALALLLFGPKKLPVLARELGKWVGEFRRASNEFKMQMEEELRLVEQADRQKQIAAIEAAAPIPPALEQPEHPHLPAAEPTAEAVAAVDVDVDVDDPYYGAYDDEYGESAPTTAPVSATEISTTANETSHLQPNIQTDSQTVSEPATAGLTVLPIATSGDLHLMPPATGLPTPRRSAAHGGGNPLGGLLDSIPEVPVSHHPAEAVEPTQAIETIGTIEAPTPEIAAHGH